MKTIAPIRSDYDITDDGRVVGLRPAGSEVVLRKGYWRHPEATVSVIFMPAKEAADKLFSMMRTAGASVASEEELERLQEEAAKAKGLKLWKRTRGKRQETER